MFKKKDKNIKSEELIGEPDIQPKYSKPKIMLIDLPPDALSFLKERGYNVISGSFGHPYRIKQSGFNNKVLTDAKLPNYTEQEIVVVDLSYEIVNRVTEIEIPSDYKESGLYVGRKDNIIDPRPLAMTWNSNNSKRIIEHGGIFIIFAEPRVNWIYYNENNSEKFTLDNWSFLSRLDERHITIKRDSGNEVKIEDAEKNIIKSVLADFIKENEFSCIMTPNYETDEKNWITLAKNKYGQTVSEIILINTKNKERPSWVLIFPHVKDKKNFLLDLIENALPSIAPYLFPFSEKTSWLYEKTYDLPQVNLLKDEIKRIKENCEKQVDDIEEQIEKYREENKFLYDLIKETDNILVKAVICALRTLGFTKVIDVDREIMEAGEPGGLREDVQIKDDSPIIILDVKGIANLPSDPDVMQSHKHATIRMKEWKRTDIKSLTIINHQRHLPPLVRDNNMPFRKEILDSASQIDLGLMTSWDLYRLLRGFLRNKWKSENVKPLFYKSQRISIIPTNYEYVGKVQHIWKEVEAFGVIIEDSQLGSQDKIGIETPIEILEYEILSLRLNDENVEKTEIGNEVGIKTSHFPINIKKGFRVYKIRN